ncbi:hypothetical protein D9M69_573170 [compost metagenome]
MMQGIAPKNKAHARGVLPVGKFHIIEGIPVLQAKPGRQRSGQPDAVSRVVSGSRYQVVDTEVITYTQEPVCG